MSNFTSKVTDPTLTLERFLESRVFIPGTKWSPDRVPEHHRRFKDLEDELTSEIPPVFKTYDSVR